MSAVYMTAFSVGMHAACLAGHLTLMTTGASLNHADFDLEIRFLGADDGGWETTTFDPLILVIARYCLYIYISSIWNIYDKPVVST